MNMETFVIVRDECRALSSALELAMVDGYAESELAELHRKCRALAGSLLVFAGSVGLPAAAELVRKLMVAETEIEAERREIGRLRIEVRECHAELEKAVAVALKAAEQNEDLVRKLAELGEQLGRP